MAMLGLPVDICMYAWLAITARRHFRVNIAIKTTWAHSRRISLAVSEEKNAGTNSTAIKATFEFTNRFDRPKVFL